MNSLPHLNLSTSNLQLDLFDFKQILSKANINYLTDKIKSSTIKPNQKFIVCLGIKNNNHIGIVSDKKPVVDKCALFIDKPDYHCLKYIKLLYLHQTSKEFATIILTKYQEYLLYLEQSWQKITINNTDFNRIPEYDLLCSKKSYAIWIANNLKYLTFDNRHFINIEYLLSAENTFAKQAVHNIRHGYKINAFALSLIIEYCDLQGKANILDDTYLFLLKDIIYWLNLPNFIKGNLTSDNYQQLYELYTVSKLEEPLVLPINALSYVNQLEEKLVNDRRFWRFSFSERLEDTMFNPKRCKRNINVIFRVKDQNDINALLNKTSLAVLFKTIRNLKPNYQIDLNHNDKLVISSITKKAKTSDKLVLGKNLTSYLSKN